MELTINGKKKDAGDIDTLDELMTGLGYDAASKGMAVAVNGTVIPRGRWKTTSLNAGDSIEIIHAVQGG
jgi:sulfur carrier protein